MDLLKLLAANRCGEMEDGQGCQQRAWKIEKLLLEYLSRE